MPRGALDEPARGEEQAGGAVDVAPLATPVAGPHHVRVALRERADRGLAARGRRGEVTLAGAAVGAEAEFDPAVHPGTGRFVEGGGAATGTVPASVVGCPAEQSRPEIPGLEVECRKHAAGWSRPRT